MIDLAVYNKEGKEVDSLKVDESVFGGEVKYQLLKQAIVMYHANKRVGTAANKGRSEKAGSGSKLFRQKGTGNARVGTRRTNKRVGGGVAFAKKVRDFSKRMPRKQKKVARNSAILAKLQSEDVIVIDELKFDSPKTKDFANILDNLKVNRSCLVGLKESDSNVWMSLRNIPKVSMLDAKQLNAGDICNHRKLLLTKDAFLALSEEN